MLGTAWIRGSWRRRTRWPGRGRDCWCSHLRVDRAGGASASMLSAARICFPGEQLRCAGAVPASAFFLQAEKSAASWRPDLITCIGQRRKRRVIGTETQLFESFPHNASNVRCAVHTPPRRSFAKPRNRNGRREVGGGGACLQRHDIAAGSELRNEAVSWGSLQFTWEAGAQGAAQAGRHRAVSLGRQQRESPDSQHSRQVRHKVRAHRKLSSPAAMSGPREPSRTGPTGPGSGRKVSPSPPVRAELTGPVASLPLRSISERKWAGQGRRTNLKERSEWAPPRGTFAEQSPWLSSCVPIRSTFRCRRQPRIPSLGGCRIQGPGYDVVTGAPKFRLFPHHQLQWIRPGTGFSRRTSKALSVHLEAARQRNSSSVPHSYQFAQTAGPWHALPQRHSSLRLRGQTGPGEGAWTWWSGNLLGRPAGMILPAASCRHVACQGAGGPRY